MLIAAFEEVSTHDLADMMQQ